MPISGGKPRSDEV